MENLALIPLGKALKFMREMIFRRGFEARKFIDSQGRDKTMARD